MTGNYGKWQQDMGCKKSKKVNEILPAVYMESGKHAQQEIMVSNKMQTV